MPRERRPTGAAARSEANGIRATESSENPKFPAYRSATRWVISSNAVP